MLIPLGLLTYASNDIVSIMHGVHVNRGISVHIYDSYGKL